MANAVQKADNRLPAIIKMIEDRADEFKKSLPAHIPSDKFVRVIKTAIGANPDLAKCDPGLLIIECQKCAADGLVADGRQAVIQVYNMNKRIKQGNQWVDNWQKVPKYIPMKDGLITRARNSGELVSIAGYIVYEEEAKNPKPAPGVPGFRRWIDEDGEHIQHEPMVRPRGKVAGAYSMARLKGGVIDFCWMPIEDIDSIKARSKSKDKDGNAVGPWKSDENQMRIKTVFRRHSKTLPMDSDLARVFQRDDDMTDLDAGSGLRRGGPTKPAGRAAEILNDHDPETGEVIEGEVVENDRDPEPEPERDPAPRQSRRRQSESGGRRRASEPEPEPEPNRRRERAERSEEDDPI